MTYEQCLLAVLVGYSLVGLISKNPAVYLEGRKAFEFLWTGGVLWCAVYLLEWLFS